MRSARRGTPRQVESRAGLLLGDGQDRQEDCQRELVDCVPLSSPGSTILLTMSVAAKLEINSDMIDRWDDMQP